LLENHFFMDFWHYHLRALSLAVEVHLQQHAFTLSTFLLEAKKKGNERAVVVENKLI
jgi:hypothetical protein